MIEHVRRFLRSLRRQPDDEGIAYYCPSCRALPGSPCTERVRILSVDMLEPDWHTMKRARTHRARRNRAATGRSRPAK